MILMDELDHELLSLFTKSYGGGSGFPLSNHFCSLQSLKLHTDADEKPQNSVRQFFAEFHMLLLMQEVKPLKENPVPWKQSNLM